MSRHPMAALALAAALTLAPWGAAHAGRHCEPQPPQVATVQRAMGLAQRVHEHLNASDAQVVVLARIGQNLKSYGQHYSHVGLAYREGNVWRVVHKLNDCGTATSGVYRQGLGEFYLDDLYEYEAGIVVLEPAVQARLLPVLKDNVRVGRLHTPAYSMLSYPWAQKYQQSNQWAIETLAMAEESGASNRVKAQAWLQLKGYEPGMVRISTAKRLGGRISAANIAFDDHPDSKRYAGRIETVTADSVFAWLPRAGLGARPIVLR